MNSNLFVTTDSKRPKSVSGLAVHWLLPRELFEHTSGAGEPITTLPHTTVQDQLVDLDVFHWVFL